MNAPDPTSLLGTTVESRYKVHQLVGAGGMCTVYRAEDLRRGSQIALKVLPAERARDTEMAARFEREAAAGKRITASQRRRHLRLGHAPRRRRSIW